MDKVSTLVNEIDSSADEIDLKGKLELIEIENDVLSASKIWNAIRKEELRDSRCCRFCGFGLKVEDCKDLGSKEEFIPIFEKIDEGVEAETLDFTINRYLPIKVIQSDPFYPRVICSPCHNGLECTIKFFDKICEGQKLLAKLLNEYPVPAVGETIDETQIQGDLQFSESNPVIKAPKRRGRPRKDPNKPVTTKNETETLLEGGDLVETRAKRQSRPPVRYMDENILIIDPFTDENLDEDIKTNTMSKEASGCSSSVRNPQENIENATKLATSISMEFSNQDQLLEMGKLSVIMDGDDEGEVQTMTEAVDISNKKLATDQNLQLPGSIEQSQGCSSKDSLSQIGTSVSLAETITLEDNSSVHENSDDDKSVKLSDLIGKKKRPIKRKRKYKKRRVLNPVVKPKLQCEQCPKSFNHSSSLKYHRKSFHDPNKNYVCDTCGKQFVHKQLLANHLSVHSSEKSFVCLACPAKFKSRASLYTHKKSIHSTSKEFTCDKCGYQFSLKSSLKAHMRIHTKEKPFVCEFCQKAFSRRCSAREHRRTHTGERPYVCQVDQCSKSFTTASQLRSHKFSHSDQKNHLCNICGKAFTHSDNFKYHMRRHSGEKPLGCPICKKQFTEPWSLKKHFRLHSGEKPFKCNVCDKRFADPSNFAKHKKVHLNPVLEAKAKAAEGQNVVGHQTNSNPTSEIQNVSSRRVVVKKTVAIAMSDVQDQIPSTSTERAVATTDSNTSSIVQILNSDGLTYHGVNDGDQDVEQVIYVYSGDSSTLFALSMSNNEQQSELTTEDESSVGGFQGLDNLGMPFTTVNTSGEFESHYYSLETVDGNTVAVPITITPGTTFGVVPNSQSSDTLPIEIASSALNE